MMLWILLMLLFVPVSAWAALTCPNEPAGSTVLTETHFDAMTANGFVDEYAAVGMSSLGSIATNQNGPASSPNALQSYYPVNHPGGNGTMKVTFGTSARREFYVCTWWKIDSPFENHKSSGTKLFYITGPNGEGHPYYFLMRNHSAPYGLWLVSQGGNALDNRHLGGICPYEGTCNLPPTGPGSLREGTFQLLEIYLRESATPTSRDGIAKWWIDGQPTGVYTNLNTIEHFGGVHINPVFGGARDQFKQQPDYMWFDAMRVSDPRGGAPPPPVTPPPVQPPPPTMDILRPVGGSIINAGATEFAWTAVSGAAQYILNVHEEGQSYDCTLMTFCGNLPGTSKLVTVKPGKKVDWWVQAVTAQGTVLTSRGSAFTVRTDVVPPPPVQPPPVVPPPVQPPPPVPPPPVPPPPPPSGTVFSHIREENGALIFEYREDTCPKGTRRFIRGRETKTITITCER